MQTKKTLLVEFIKKNKKPIIASFIFGFLSIIATLLVPLFIGEYYQVAFHKHSTRGKMFNHLFGSIKGIEQFFIYFLLLLLSKFIFDYLVKYFTGLSGELFSKSIRERLFYNQLNVKYEIHESKETGLYLLRYSGDLGAIQHYLTKGIISFVNDCFFMIFAIVILCLLNFKLTLIIIASYPIIFFTVLFLNKKLKNISRKRRNTRSKNLAFVSSRLNTLLTIKAFNREKIESDKYVKGSTQLFYHGKDYYKLYSLISALLPFLLYGMLAIILIVVYSTNHLEHKKIHGSIIVTFIMVMINTLPVLRRILGVNFIWQTGDISFTKLLKIYNGELETKNSLADQNIKTGSIVFKNVNFSFSEENTLIKNLSFEIPQNCLTIVQGEHQSGKSTLFKMLLGLYSCSKGEIFIDNQNIYELDNFTLRKKITVVSDEFPLIGKTIFEAISYSRREEKRVPAFLMLQKLGYAKENDDESILKNPIFENGKNISTSQRKVLMLARALLTNKKIILLDEPFEGLDETISNKIFSILLELKKKKTILVIDSKRNKNTNYDLVIDLNHN